ncbi:MAG TPA: alpha/beta fold hydrolase [Verrucomicrobiae bacterium]|nr:alpha/beta fold hydrolase [Verrucomicrobiae bacterium]
MQKTFLLIGGLLLFAGCSSTPDAPTAPPILVPVFYGTDRMATPAADLEDTYGAERGPQTFGLAQVSIPPDHETGRIEEPSLINLEFSEQSDRHVVLQALTPTPQPTFLDALQRHIRETGNNAVFIFVHGFNVSFAEAVRRTAQIAYDLDWQGTAVLYSWPSAADTNSYDSDRENAVAAVQDLAAFIETVAVYSGAAQVHVIAHSMGNEPLLAALALNTASTSATGVPLLDQVVLAAPDVAADEFSQLVVRAAPAAKHFTLYVSKGDTALQAAALLSDVARAGDSSDGVLILPGVDTIDATAAESDIVGHSYYGENRAILADIFSLLKTGMPPDQRFGLQAADSDGQKYWILQP